MDDHSKLPTLEVVIRNGSPVWRVCGMGLCVEDRSGTRAQEAFRVLCLAKGLHPPVNDDKAPCRGPSEVDEPGL
jgi:hypothetical protein